MHPAPAGEPEPRAIPMRMGTDEQFDTLGSQLRELHFDEASICARTGAASIFDFRRKLEGRAQGRDLADALDALIHLLMDGEALAWERVRALLPAAMADALTGLGLLASLDNQPELSYATVALYPVAGVYIASDRALWIDGTDVASLKDSVYPAITRNTHWFLSALPQTPCEDLLDLCAGSGVAGIAAARFAGRVWACDLAGRSAHFAEFNARLNGFRNVTCAAGDLYQPVGELAFDRIVAHPPYVPATEQQVLFRDGGQDGEQILRGVIEGLPRHLRPGGRCYCMSMATDREGETVEQRIRRWLGEHESEFDLVLVSYSAEAKPESLLQVLRSRNSRCLQVPAHSEIWQRLKVTGVFLGAIVLERKLAARPAVTVRMQKAEEAGSETIEWLARWAQSAAPPGFDEFLLRARPRLASTLELGVTHTVENGALIPTRFELHSAWPFQVRAACPNWLAVVAGACDGQRTTREVYLEMRKQEVIHPSMTPEQFGQQIGQLVQHGLLELDEFPLPKRPA